ncbi:MAG: FadR family transcriptional regulator [Chloroflexi bacterium]|nr:FadR family transcriptional regulator [Chloroflexota bacterium]
MALQRLSRQTLADQAADSLEKYIEESQLSPGDVLPSEAVLTSMLGVSRPVVREALKALVGRSIIQIVNGKGAIVKPLDSDDLSTFFKRAVGFDKNAVRELLEVRRGLEVEMARLAAQRRTDEDAAQLLHLVAIMRRQLDQIEPDYVDTDLRFHLCIASATHNTMMYYLVESIRDAMRDSILQWHLREHPVKAYQQVQQIHEQIADAIRRQDADAAAEAMIIHFDNAIAYLTDSPMDTPSSS